MYAELPQIVKCLKAVERNLCNGSGLGVSPVKGLLGNAAVELGGIVVALDQDLDRRAGRGDSLRCAVGHRGALTAQLGLYETVRALAPELSKVHLIRRELLAVDGRRSLHLPERGGHVCAAIGVGTGKAGLLCPHQSVLCRSTTLLLLARLDSICLVERLVLPALSCLLLRSVHPSNCPVLDLPPQSLHPQTLTRFETVLLPLYLFALHSPDLAHY